MDRSLMDDRLRGLVLDLWAETTSLLEVMSSLSEDEWCADTPADGWRIKDQVSHLAWFDAATTLALTDPDEFRRRKPEPAAVQALVDEVTATHASWSGAALLDLFLEERSTLLAALSRAEASRRAPWYGPDMSVPSMATARIMETWAHGVDIGDAVGRPPAYSERLRHVIFLGVMAAPFSFASRGLEPPADPLLVAADTPDGSTWQFGPPDAGSVVRGPALDLALLVAQRRNVADTRVVAQGAAATAWLSVAQAFAGPPTSGRAPLDQARS